jgi:hypothetical protein
MQVMLRCYVLVAYADLNVGFPQRILWLERCVWHNDM